eukprot:2030674-Rhodomonas_salina.1
MAESVVDGVLSFGRRARLCRTWRSMQTLFLIGQTLFLIGQTLFLIGRVGRTEVALCAFRAARILPDS